MDDSAGSRAAESEEESPLRALLVAPDSGRRARRRDQLQAEGYLTWAAGTAREAGLIARQEELDVIFVELSPEPAVETDLVGSLADLPEFDGIPLVVSLGGVTLGSNLSMYPRSFVAHQISQGRSPGGL